jgi:hypothetical protein
VKVKITFEYCLDDQNRPWLSQARIANITFFTFQVIWSMSTLLEISEPCIKYLYWLIWIAKKSIFHIVKYTFILISKSGSA